MEEKVGCVINGGVKFEKVVFYGIAKKHKRVIEMCVGFQKNVFQIIQSEALDFGIIGDKVRVVPVGKATSKNRQIGD